MNQWFINESVKFFMALLDSIWCVISWKNINNEIQSVAGFTWTVKIWNWLSFCQQNLKKNKKKPVIGMFLCSSILINKLFIEFINDEISVLGVERFLLTIKLPFTYLPWMDTSGYRKVLHNLLINAPSKLCISVPPFTTCNQTTN